MFRYEVGATILVLRYENPDYEPTRRMKDEHKKPLETNMVIAE